MRDSAADRLTSTTARTPADLRSSPRSASLSSARADRPCRPSSGTGHGRAVRASRPDGSRTLRPRNTLRAILRQSGLTPDELADLLQLRSRRRRFESCRGHPPPLRRMPPLSGIAIPAGQPGLPLLSAHAQRACAAAKAAQVSLPWRCKRLERRPRPACLRLTQVDGRRSRCSNRPAARQAPPSSARRAAVLDRQVSPCLFSHWWVTYSRLSPTRPGG